KLVSLKEQTIQQANLLLVRMDYKENEENYVYFNDRFLITLGLEADKDGLMKLSDFKKTMYPDALGKATFESFCQEAKEMIHNKTDVVFGENVKHQNMLTKEAVYLDSHLTVDERYPNGVAKVISGYVINNTDKLKMIEERKLLELEKEKSSRAERLAIKSGRMMLWYLDGTELDSTKYFYGNKLLFSKLGLTEFERNKFKIEEFNQSIYDGDEEGSKLKEAYFAIDDRVENNELDSYDKLLVKHQNIITNEIFYFEHSFEVESRFEDGRLKIRGGYMADVTNEVNLKKRNEFLIGHDAITGLRNRNAFEEFINGHNMPKMYTLVIADIDGLKLINDAFGHMRGDHAITFVGQQFQTVFEDCSTIYRIGGDEFAVISREVDEQEIIKKLNLIRENIQFFNTKNEIQVGVSIGYEIINKVTADFSETFTNAENLMYRQKLRDRNSRKSKTMDAVLETLHVKTEETKEHCDRLGYYAKKTLIKLGLTRNSDLDDIEILCQVHDIGKITISEEILSKNGKLTSEEYMKIKKHSEAGYKIIKNIVDSDNIALGVLFHHEKVDGTGYPFGLKGDEIPLFAKVIAICDAYDVMISGRKYSKAMSIEAALEEIILHSGTQFDEKIATVFVQMIQESISE
ncbi:MAG: diguanylate cyclase, partial [Bacilli bacterium]|nr:diguanylate cyclase [Bacilli bacterium]